MGEEYGEPAPFQYFTSHGDPGLVEAVRRGRREEFASFGWQDSVPDPQDERTFQRSHLNTSLKSTEPHKTLYEFYQRLIRIRTELNLGRAVSKVVRELGSDTLLLGYPDDSQQSAMVFNFAEFPVILTVPELAGKWTTMLQSASTRWNGPEPDLPATITLEADRDLRISPYSFLVLKRLSMLSEAE
jgi:maltooligosyltrehalose trehalohydrolase